jgi:hypothetical protein
MSLRTRTISAPPHLPPPDELLSRRAANELVLIPDEVSPVDGQTVAGFRPATQALRVRAKEAGVPVQLVVPEGAVAGQYAERAAEWVLPLLLGVPGQVVGQLIANYLQDRLDHWRGKGNTRVPTVRYREVVIEDASSRSVVREIEGPADEMAAWLRQGAVLPAGTEGEEWGWPERD